MGRARQISANLEIPMDAHLLRLTTPHGATRSWLLTLGTQSTSFKRGITSSEASVTMIAISVPDSNGQPRCAWFTQMGLLRSSRASPSSRGRHCPSFSLRMVPRPILARTCGLAQLTASQTTAHESIVSALSDIKELCFILSNYRLMLEETGGLKATRGLTQLLPA